MRLIFLDDDEAQHAFENREEEIVEDMMMMMMMMMVFLQSKLSCDECFFFDVSTSGFLSLEKEIERGLRKKYDRHLGRQKNSKFEARRTTTTTTTKKGEGAYYWRERQCIFLFATQKRIRFRVTKTSFFKLFYKKKNLRESLGEETRKRFLPSRANRHQGVCSYLHMMFTPTNHIFL